MELVVVECPFLDTFAMGSCSEAVIQGMSLAEEMSWGCRPSEMGLLALLSAMDLRWGLL